MILDNSRRHKGKRAGDAIRAKRATCSFVPPIVLPLNRIALVFVKLEYLMRAAQTGAPFDPPLLQSELESALVKDGTVKEKAFHGKSRSPRF